MARRVRAHDWARTPLGAIGGWPQSLRTAVELTLASPQPGLIGWGPGLSVLYNDAYVALLGDRHPAALGRAFATAWPGPAPSGRIAATLAGEAWHFIDQPLELPLRAERRTGWFTGSWTPLRDESGTITGIYGCAFETTERVLAEAALRESEERFRTLAESIDDVFYVTDLERNRLDYLSPSYERIWGRPAAELLRDLSAFTATIHPDDRARFAEHKARQERGEPVIAQYRIVRPDAEVRWIFDRSFPIPGQAGKRSAGVATDITARIAADGALRESQERFRLIVESARDYAILITDEHDRIVDWLPGAANVFGWTAGEVIGKSAELLFVPGDRERRVPQIELAAALRDGVAPDVRWHLHKDGRHVFIEGSVTALRRPDGSLRGFLKIGQDTTERRRAQERLRDSEERFRTFAEASSDLLWIRDAGTLHLEYLSPAFEAIYGESREPFLGGGNAASWLDLIHPDDRMRAVENLERARAGERVSQEIRIRRRGEDEPRWIHDTVFPLLDDQGRVQRIAGITKDVTEAKTSATRLQVLVAELQHRTRNLIGVIRSMSDRTAAGSMSLDDFRDRFWTRLAALARVNGLLSRLGEGTRVTFDELIRTELAGHGALNESGRGRQVTLDGPPGVPLRSSTLQTFALALHELATNAVKHGALSRPEGRLTIRWRVSDGGRLRLRVDWQETGVRLPPANGRPRRGFGRELIERALPYQLEAETRYELHPEGVRCSIVLPISSHQPEAHHG